MAEAERTVDEVYLQPGEYFFARQPTIIWTILGSCVSAAFWCKKFNAGALCHAMLPVHPQLSMLSAADSYRYMDHAVRDIARQFDELGARRSDIEIKLFGGADVLVNYRASSVKGSIGNLNLESALKVLADEGLEVVASSTGGNSGLKIYFNTATGEVLLRRLSTQTSRGTR